MREPGEDPGSGGTRSHGDDQWSVRSPGGKWTTWSPADDSVDHTNASVTGIARIRLYKGRAMNVGATSPHTLYDPKLASFSMEGYDVTAARGFIDLFGLPMKVASQAKRW